MYYGNYRSNKFDYFKLGQRGKSRMTISSNSIKDGEAIQKKYAKHGQNISPHIRIEHVPTGAKQVLLMMYDPDAQKVVGKTFVHWAILLEPSPEQSSMIEIPEGEDTNNIHGQILKNDFGDKGYGGPAPPSGQHTYHIKAYALSSKLEPGSTTYASIQSAIADYIVASAEIVGTYKHA